MTLRPICPGCDRPYHPQSRVPLTAWGEVGLCRECRDEDRAAQAPPLLEVVDLT